MATATRKSLVPESKVVSTQAIYDIEIEGVCPLILNKIPDLTIGKASGRNQAQKDKWELEQETWRDKLHTDADGMVIIPPLNVWKSLVAGAKSWGGKIKGARGKGYASLLPENMIVMTPVQLGIHRDDEKKITPFTAPCNGSPTTGKRAMVPKIRPMITTWRGEFRIAVSNALLTPDVLATVTAYAGKAGFGDWRPHYGCFKYVGIYEV